MIFCLFLFKPNTESEVNVSSQADSFISQRKKWLSFTIHLAMIGIALSAYATNHHLLVKSQGATDAACNISSKFNCDDVARSELSEIFSIPMGIWGIGFFLSIAVLGFLAMRRGKDAEDNMSGLAGLVVIGSISSLGLGIYSTTKLGVVCPTCLGIYIVSFLQLVLLFLNFRCLKDVFTFKRLVNGGLTGVLVVGITAAAYSFFSPAKQPQTPTELTDQASLLPNLDITAHSIPISTSQYSGLGEDYRKGLDDAPVTIVEFADFQCPACSRMANLLDRVAKQYNGKVRVVFRNYPLDQKCNSSINQRFHEQACDLSVMARCAGQYGKFWQYHDLVFANQQSVNSANVLKWAKDVGLSQEQINTCKASKSILDKVKEDIALANKVGVSATPTIFINGQKFMGSATFEVITYEINKILSR